MKKLFFGLIFILTVFPACQDDVETQIPEPFAINLSQTTISCFPKDVRTIDFDVTGPEASNLKLSIENAEPWSYKLLEFKPSDENTGYHGTINITAPSKKSDAGRYSTINIRVYSDSYSTLAKVYLIVNPEPPQFTAKNLDTDFKINEKREIFFSCKSEESVNAFLYRHTNKEWAVYLEESSLRFYSNSDFSNTSGIMIIQAPDKPSETDATLLFEGNRPYQALQITIHSETWHLKCTN